MIEYKYKKRENKFTEDGHTMFEFDVLQRLKRLAYLEDQIIKGELLHKPLVSNSEAAVCDDCKKPITLNKKPAHCKYCGCRIIT